MKELDLWIFIYNKLNKYLRVKLLIVADSSNSSPGRAGFKMAVSEDVETYGTIGGGIMEYNILSEINGLLAEDNSENIIRKLIHSKTKDGVQSGLICGGTQTLIVYSLDKNYRDTIKNIIDHLELQTKGILTITKNKIFYRAGIENKEQIKLEHISDEEWKYEENLGFSDTVYIIGGGHVGLAVAKIMSTLDFFVVTFDQRDDVITMKKNIYSNQKIKTNYNEVSKYITESNRSYVVIVTPNHDGDKEALKSIINMNLRYIGLMGSEKKSKSIFRQLEEEGIDSELFKKIHTPIGLEIYAESPEEIAISIAAEIIKIKNS